MFFPKWKDNTVWTYKEYLNHCSSSPSLHKSIMWASDLHQCTALIAEKAVCNSIRFIHNIAFLLFSCSSVCSWNYTDFFLTLTSTKATVNNMIFVSGCIKRPFKTEKDIVHISYTRGSIWKRQKNVTRSGNTDILISSKRRTALLYNTLLARSNWTICYLEVFSWYWWYLAPLSSAHYVLIQKS